MTKICFLAGVSGRDKLSYKLYTALAKKYTFDYCFLAFTQKDISYLKGKGIKSSKIIYTDIHDWKSIRLNMKYLQAAEKKYGIPNLWLYWTSIRSISKTSHTDALRIMQKSIMFYESFMEKHQPTYIVGDAIASLPVLFMDEIARAHNVRHIQLAQSKIPGKFILKESRYDRWFQLDKELELLRKRKLTTAEIKKAKDFIKNFLEKKDIPTYEKFLKKKKFISLRSLRLLITYFYTFYAKKAYKSYRSNFFSPFIHVSKKIKDTIKQKIHDYFNPFFEKPVKGEKYILFPLHYQPEASTIIYAPFWINQLFLVETLSKSIPVGYKLYVKEHSNGYGRRPFSFFKTIRSHPNVRLIHPKENIHPIIKGSSLISVITSTTGWEGLVYKKPVISFGNAFFNSCSLIHHTTDIVTLPETIARMINEPPKDDQELYRFILAMLNTSFEGNPAIPDTCNGESLKDENIEKMVQALNTVFKFKVKQ